ncbi:MAG: heavy-metal-associated domain-containing protein [Clostridiales bacterium]|nr:heavy-metal-associated domain-containing protein [Clostridiales bacterium]
MSKTLKVEGMSCGHCVNRVKNAIEELQGVSNVEVSLEKKNAVVDYDEKVLSSDVIIAAIEEVGYDATLD